MEKHPGTTHEIGKQKSALQHLSQIPVILGMTLLGEGFLNSMIFKLGPTSLFPHCHSLPLIDISLLSIILLAQMLSVET